MLRKKGEPLRTVDDIAVAELDAMDHYELIGTIVRYAHEAADIDGLKVEWHGEFPCCLVKLGNGALVIVQIKEEFRLHSYYYEEDDDPHDIIMAESRYVPMRIPVTVTIVNQHRVMVTDCHTLETAE